MKATLYLPQQLPRVITTEVALPDGVTHLGQMPLPERVPALLDCAPGLVDVLASGPHYVAYSVFDSEGDLNSSAMSAVEEVSGVAFDIEDEDSVLRGPVLIVRNDQPTTE